MNFNDHSELRGTHAFLSASQYHWLNYDEAKAVKRYKTHMATQRGTELHDLAEHMIRLGIKANPTGQTFNSYVNDAIQFGMTPEVVLFYSYNCYGTADALLFKDNILRIHDLKTGETPAHMEQLLIYAALFCLEYKTKPGELDEIILRIYQYDTYVEYKPTVDEIAHVIDKIISLDKAINNAKKEDMGIA